MAVATHKQSQTSAGGKPLGWKSLLIDDHLRFGFRLQSVNLALS